MLICPQCKFKNPDGNKFCQGCGTSLSQKICPECGADVDLNLHYCYKCGAACSKIWYVIITQVLPNLIPTVEETKESTQNSQGDVGQFYKFILDSYLDPQQRYRLLESPPTPEVIGNYREVRVRVLDYLPYHTAMPENEAEIATNAVPELARTYLKLQMKIHSAIPTIHDAWQQNDFQVILLEDRSDWPMLLNVEKKETASILEILHWFYQMTQFWELLEEVNCRQSLLDLSNLRLDEDRNLVLQRLYIEPSVTQSLEDNQQSVTIKNLGQVWQNLFKQSQFTQFSSIIQMFEDVESGNILTLTQLRSRLQEIIIELSPQDKPSSVATILQLDGETEAKNDDIPTLVLSMQLSSLEYVAHTDIGRQRDHNEDYFGVNSQVNKLELPGYSIITAQGLYVLCDGMGGHAGGEIASELAVNTIRQHFQKTWTDKELPARESIREAVYLANQAIYELNQQESRAGVGRMGTTLVMLLLQDNQAAIAHVGDSRLYCLTRKRGLEQITVDHEVGQREIARGVEPSIAYGRADAYQLTQALGPRNEQFLHPDVEFFDIHEDMLLALVSDGLSDNDCLETHWQSHLQPLLSSNSNLETGIQNLIKLGNEHNGHDNITAILVRVRVRPYQES